MKEYQHKADDETALSRMYIEFVEYIAREKLRRQYAEEREYPELVDLGGEGG